MLERGKSKPIHEETMAVTQTCAEMKYPLSEILEGDWKCKTL